MFFFLVSTLVNYVYYLDFVYTCCPEFVFDFLLLIVLVLLTTTTDEGKEARNRTREFQGYMAQSGFGENAKKQVSLVHLKLA